MMPPPRPFRVTRCTIRDRDELVQVLRLADAALRVRNEDDGVAGMRIVFAELAAAEPSMTLVRDEFFNAASWGAAYHRLQLGEYPSVPASSLRADAGFVDALLWNALAWTGIEVSCRLEPRLSALGDYCVKVGYYVAHHGPSGTAALEAELNSWTRENAQVLSDYTFRAYVDSQLIGEFWLDVDSAPHARSSMPIRPARSIEKVYDDFIFDIAWDDLNEALGRGRPRKTVHLDNLAPVEWEPTLTSQNLFSLPQRSENLDKLDLTSVLSGRSNGNHLHESAPAPSRLSAPPTPLPPAYDPYAYEPVAESAQPTVHSGPLVMRPPAAIERDVPPLVMRPAPPVYQSRAAIPMAPAPVAKPEPEIPPMTMSPVTPPPAPTPPIAAPPITVPPVAAPPITVPPVAVPPITLPPVHVVDELLTATIDLRPVVVPAPTIYDFPPPQRLDIAAGWYKDPRRGFDFRWWDGSRWTDVVSHDGTTMDDPLQSPQHSGTF